MNTFIKTTIYKMVDKKDLTNKASRFYKENSKYFKEVNSVLYFSEEKYIKSTPLKKDEKNKKFIKSK